jgi:hypothetical protein
MPGGEQREFDEQLNDDFSKQVLDYRKSQKDKGSQLSKPFILKI